MLRLIRHELKKIFTSRLTITMLLIGFFLIIYSFIWNCMDYKIYDKNGNPIEGQKAVTMQKDKYKDIFNRLQTDDEVSNNISFLSKYYDANKNKTVFDINKALPQNIYYGFYKPREDYFDWIADNYSSIHGGNFESVHSIMQKSKNLPKFSMQRENKIKEKLEKHPFIKYSDSEKKFWYQKANLTRGPYKYGYYEAWSKINASLDMFLFLLLAIGIGVCGVFSKEHETGADAILLSSKFGKSKLIIAKIVASLIFISITILLGLLICIIPNLIYYGSNGWNLPIQILSTKILYNWNFIQLIIVRIIIFTLVALSISAISLILSSIIKRTTPTAIIVIMIIFGSIFLPNLDNSLYRLIVSVFPVQINAALYYDAISYLVLGRVLTIYTFAIIVYSLISFVLFPLSGKVFKMHQVK